MPLATNPKALFTAVLESDKDLPEEKQPRFIYHYLTGLQQIEVSQTLDNLEESVDGAEAINKVFGAAATEMVDWKNVRDSKGKSIPFDPAKLKEIMGMAEAKDLAYKLIVQSPSFEDKKKSESQSPSSSESSAKTAKDGKSAETSQAQSSQ